jgi:hypothetical protein
MKKLLEILTFISEIYEILINASLLTVFLFLIFLVMDSLIK